MHSPAHLTLDPLERAPETAGTDVRPSECDRPSEPDFSLNRLFHSSDAARPRLRIGVMINRGNAAQLFMRKILEDIRDCDFARLECVIENCEPPATPRPARRRSLASRLVKHLVDRASRQRLFYFGYVRLLDAPRRPLPDPYSVVDCSDLFEGAPRVEVMPLRKGFVHRFPPEALERIRAFDLDVILRFGFNIIRGDILAAARHGVWSYHHGDSECYRGGPSQLWEIIEGNPLTGVVLQRLDETLDAGPALRRAILSTCPRPWVSVNRYNVYWSTQHFVIQKLYELHRYGAEHIEQHVHRCGVYRGKRELYRKPSNLDMARWLAPLAVRSVRRRIAHRSEITHWRIGLRQSSRPLYEQPESAQAPAFTWFDSPRGRFWADPFLIEEGGDAWIFFEDFNRAEKRGVIGCGKVVDGRLSEVRTALQRPHHLSYPYIFRHAGAVWMVPESEQAGKVQLYRAARFPDDWVLERTLLDLRAVDSALFQFEGKWWLLTSPLVVRGHTPSTFLFAAPEPWGPWKLHPAGCICSDVRWARGAGSIIVRGDRLIRPSQDCSKGYGYSISFNEVKLDETHYEETHRSQLLPDMVGRIAGVHTYNRAGNWEVIDGRTPTPRRAVT